MPDQFRLQVLTPDEVVLDEPVESAMLPAVDGSLQIVPGRWSLVTVLRAECINYRREGSERCVAVQGGIARFADNTLQVLTSDAALDAGMDELRDLQERREDEMSEVDRLSEFSFERLYGMLTRRLGRRVR